MSIGTWRDFERLKEIGRVVRLVLDGVAAAVEPGVSTRDLDVIGGRLLASEGAVSAPPAVYGFPGQLCISVNDEAIHGIPGKRVLRDGDLVKLDLVASKDGYYADAAVTVEAGRGTELGRRLRRSAEASFAAGLAAAKPGNRAYDIGREIDKRVRFDGFHILRDLCGHGVGRTIHEEPSIPNFKDPNCRARLTEGLVITIEPILSAGTREVNKDRDGWTIRTGDRSWAAHFEHTVVVMNGGPVLLTAA